VSSTTVQGTPRNFAKAACWALLVCSALALVPVQNRIAGERGVYGPVEDILYMPSGKVVRRLSLGNEGLLADIYWTRVVQYFGRKRLAKDVRYDLLGPLLRITTDLDPHLLIAYRFGAIFLSGRAPEGAGHPQEALQLLRRGIVANPDYWRLWQDLGFVYYWDLKDYKHAVRAFTTGSEQPGAQLWLKALAAMVAAKGGDPEASKLLWTQIYRHAENQAMRESAVDHLAALTAHEQIQELNQLLDKYHAKEGRSAHSIRDLIAAGLLRGVPLDPSGVPYAIKPDGKAGLGAQSKVKLRLIL
jgi:hypothetical protein